MMNFEKKAETMHEVMSSIKSSRTENDILATIKDEFDCIYSVDGLRLIKMNNSKIRSYIVKDTVQVICDNAFKDCKQLRTIELPGTLITIGRNAFSNCRMLHDITLPQSLQHKIGRAHV